MQISISAPAPNNSSTGSRGYRRCFQNWRSFQASSQMVSATLRRADRAQIFAFGRAGNSGLRRTRRRSAAASCSAGTRSVPRSITAALFSARLPVSAWDRATIAADHAQVQIRRLLRQRAPARSRCVRGSWAFPPGRAADSRSAKAPGNTTTSAPRPAASRAARTMRAVFSGKSPTVGLICARATRIDLFILPRAPARCPSAAFAKMKLPHAIRRCRFSRQQLRSRRLVRRLAQSRPALRIHLARFLVARAMPTP